jgi:hypothetical protein
VPLGEARLATGSDALCVACGQRPRAVAFPASRLKPLGRAMPHRKHTPAWLLSQTRRSR